MRIFRAISALFRFSRLARQLTAILRAIVELSERTSTDLHDLRNLIMSLKNSIARLTALSERIAAAVAVEAAEAAAKIKLQQDAIAEKDAALASLRAAFDAAIDASNAEAAELSEALDRVEAATSAIGDIILNDNPTPIADVVVESVQEDEAPTPPAIADTPIAPATPTEGGDVAVGAIAEAIEEVIEEVR
jgi:uncharacterized membrane protein YccC